MPTDSYTPSGPGGPGTCASVTPALTSELNPLDPVDLVDPARVVHTALGHLLDHDMTAFSDLFAEDATMEFPFAPSGRPQRLHGRDQVAAYLSDYTDLLDIHEITDVTLHQPPGHTVVLEFTARGLVVATAAPYTARYVAIITTTTDGRVQHYRDYWDPTGFTEVPVGAALAAS